MKTHNHYHETIHQPTITVHFLRINVSKLKNTQWGKAKHATNTIMSPPIQVF